MIDFRSSQLSSCYKLVEVEEDVDDELALTPLPDAVTVQGLSVLDTVVPFTDTLQKVVVKVPKADAPLNPKEKTATNAKNDKVVRILFMFSPPFMHLLMQIKCTIIYFD